MQATLRLAVVIVSWNTAQLLRQCLLSVKTEFVRAGLSESNCAVCVVDNDSSDGSAELVASEFPWVKLTANQQNLGFAAANN